MRNLILAILLAIPAQAFAAASERCWQIQDNAAASIASGAISTSAWQASLGGLLPTQMERPTYIRVDFDLVDASGGVTNIRATFTGASASGGTYRPVAELLDGNYSAPLARDWDPRANGKSWSTGRIAWSHAYGTLTATPIGYGTGDTLAIEIYGCTGDMTPEKSAPPDWPAFKAGGWTKVDCSGGAAYSGQLAANAWFVLQAVGGDAYWAQTVAGSGTDADSADGYLPEGDWAPMSTHNGNRYFSCDGSADTADVRYIEVQ